MKKLMNVIVRLICLAIIGGVAGGLAAHASQLSPSVWDRSTSVSTSSAAILPADNGSRRYLLIENVCTSNVGISVDSTTAAIASAGTVTLTPGGSLEFKAPDVPQNAFNAISASGTCAITIWEIR